MDELRMFFTRHQTSPSQQTHLTDVLEPSDPRTHSSEMLNEIHNEIRDLIKRGTFKMLMREELPDGANALTARFVLAIKSTTDGQVKYKARHVIGGHTDKMKHYLAYYSQTVSPASTRLLLALAATFGF